MLHVLQWGVLGFLHCRRGKMELAPTPSPSQMWSPDSAWSSPPQYSSPEDTEDDGLGLDNVERWELSRERQKFRRYRTRHLPSSSIFARDLQFPVKREHEHDPVQRESIEDEIGRRSENQDGSTPSKERLRKPLRIVKEEPEELSDSGELSFERFASALDSWLHGFSSLPDLLQDFEVVCRDLAEAVRDEASERHRVIEDRLMRQKAQMLHSEAASWALLWHLFGKNDEEMDFEHGKSLSTSAQIARDFVKTDGTAQICLRLVQWLEELASKELDLEKKRKGWYAGSYMQRLGLWDQTKQAIRKNVGTQYVRHLDPDAPTREGVRIHPEDQKLEEGLLEDVWRLIRAGRIAEAQNLCRNAGQAWRAASLGGCLMGYSPSTESWESAGKDRVLEAIELDGGLGRQRRIWKWACFCASEKIATSDGGRYESAVFSAQCGNVKHMLPICSDWESACWALVRSWLDVQIELELVHRQEIATPDTRSNTTSGPESWPHPVLDQQPRDFISLFQKLYSGNLVQDNVRRSCKEQHRLVQMDLVLTDIADLLDLLKSWILPAREDTKLHGHPQMIRFAAHLVLVLRSILPEELKEKYNERLELVGDLIINTYAIFLFAQHKEELVGAYASHLAPHLCVDLYVHMMELRQNDSELVKRKIFCSAMEYLPFYAEDEAKGSISVICDRFLENSREVKPGISHVKVEEPGEYQRLASLQKGQSVQWMCFTPPAGLPNSEQLRTELLARALNHSNVLFREISLVSLWRSTNVPEGARILLGHLAEPLKEDTDALFSVENHRAKENYQEFLEWQEYFACDACYRSWLTCETFASSEERDKSLAAGKQALDAATSLLHRNEALWLAGSDVTFEGAVEWLEFSVTAGLSKLSNPCLVPDPTICTALTSALYLCMGEVASSERQLKVHVAVNPKNENFLDIGLRCLAAEGEGIGSQVTEDGGFLSAIMATAIKGELPHFQAGVALEVLRMDAWCISTDGIQEEAAFLVRGLCRRCCLPELVLRCMQIRAWLQALGATVQDNEDDLLGLVASGDGLHSLFSRKQLEEFLVLEREIVIRRMEAVEDGTAWQDMSE